MIQTSKKMKQQNLSQLLIKNKKRQLNQYQKVNNRCFQSLKQCIRNQSASSDTIYKISEYLSETKSKITQLERRQKQKLLLISIITEQQILKYNITKQKKTANTMTIQTLKLCRKIYQIIQNQINNKSNQISKTQNQISNTQDDISRKQYKIINEQNLDQNLSTKLQKQLNSFTNLIKSVEDLQDYFTHNSQFFSNSQVFLRNIYTSLITKIQQLNPHHKQMTKFKEIIQKYYWPLKRNKSQINTNLDNIKQQDIDFIVQILHRQSCEFAFINYLSSLVDQKEATKYNSDFFSIFNQKISKSIQYLFMQKSQSHNIQQPNWLFQYLQQVFQKNYILLKQLLSKYSNQIQIPILIYILQYNLSQLFMPIIIHRLQIDIQLIRQTKTSQSYFYFKFLDSLADLQHKFTLIFQQQINFVEKILQQFQIHREIKLLKSCFDYQHQWMEQKIFHDFYSINYSHIDLKNIEAYNIVIHFNVLFQRLYNKFASISDPTLNTKINQFYQQSIRNLIAHIKTSFDRIYHHSGLASLQIIVAFKRVDNEFRSGLLSFISKDQIFQKQVKEQYFDYIISLFNVYALEQLGSYHRKVLKLTTQYQHNFSGTQVSQETIREMEAKFEKLFKSWQQKLTQLNSVYNYKDFKLKNMFYMFLESSEFTQKGISLFLKFYSPFLQLFYSQDAFNIIKMIVCMDKKEQIQYLDHKKSITSFLLETQINAIRKMKIK